MRTIIQPKAITLIFMSIWGMAVSAQSGPKNFIDQNYIEVSGTAGMEITPDLIYLDIRISENDDMKNGSLAEIEELMIKQLNAAGIDTGKDLTIKDFSSTYKDYWLTKSDVLLSKEYQLLVHDVTTLQKVFQELKQAGISNITISRFDHSAIQQYKKEVKISAIKAARDKAVFLAGAIDQSIGKAIHIQETGAGHIATRIAGVNANAQFRLEEPWTDESGQDLNMDKIRLEYTIQVCFELK